MMTMTMMTMMKLSLSYPLSCSFLSSASYAAAEMAVDKVMQDNQF
jgi:hypothetical protein